MRHYKTMSVLISLTLLLLVTGCANTRTVYKTNTVYLTPPAILIADQPVPEYTGSTWADVLAYAGVLQSELRMCNWDKARLREWVKEHE